MIEINRIISLRELAKRTPIVASVVAFGSISLDILINPQPVGAVGKDCLNTQVDMVGAGYVKNPLIATNNMDKAESADIVVSSPEIGVVVIERPENPQDPKSPRTEITRGNLVNRGRYSDQLFKLVYQNNTPVKSNTILDGREAIEIYWYAENDRPQLNPETSITEKPRGKAVIPCGFTWPVSVGMSAPGEVLQKALDIPSYRFDTVAAVINDSFRSKVGQGAGLGPETVNQTEVRRAFAEFLKKQVQTATPTPTGTARGTETPTPTGTRPATSPTPTATRIPETPTATATVTATSPVASPTITATPDVTPTPATGGGFSFPNVDLSAVGSVADLPAKALDQITENDVEQPIRAGVDVAGWLAALAALALLTNRPTTGLQRVRLNRLRERLVNTVAWPVRYRSYKRALSSHMAQVNAGVTGLGPTPTAPVRPWGI